MKLYDIHTHVGTQINNLYNEKFFPRNKNIKDLIDSYQGEIDKIVTFPMPSITENTVIPYKFENQELLYSIEKEKVFDKILPFICLHPRIKVSEQLENILNIIKNYNIYGIKFHTLDTKSYISDFFKNSEITSFCKQYNLPVLIHSANFEGYENCDNIFYYASKFPNINILVAHMMGFSKTFFERLSNYKGNNIFFDTSPFLGMCNFYNNFENKDNILDINFSNPREVLHFLYLNFPNNIIWGSDQPFENFSDDDINNYNIRNELDFLFSLEKSTINKIASENSENFLF
ncbi:hypothetical protein BLD25_04620 [Candidatus Gracilibacteria bacterium GN02-872]|nr:hypothetical protein BLD25_04620 [Candidatus Gracilibacteria bacterium GN02-872]